MKHFIAPGMSGKDDDSDADPIDICGNDADAEGETDEDV